MQVAEGNDLHTPSPGHPLAHEQQLDVELDPCKDADNNESHVVPATEDEHMVSHVLVAATRYGSVLHELNAHAHAHYSNALSASEASGPVGAR